VIEDFRIVEIKHRGNDVMWKHHTLLDVFSPPRSWSSFARALDELSQNFDIINMWFELGQVAGAAGTSNLVITCMIPSTRIILKSRRTNAAKKREKLQRHKFPPGLFDDPCIEAPLQSPATRVLSSNISILGS
jgi:hypothetical protein